jgi:predicted amidohydrolase YtcJ
MARLGSRVLLRGGSIVSSTVADATSMLVVDGTVGWLGTDPSAHADEATVIDLEGRLVTPGFVDAHVHLAPTGIALASVDLSAATDLQSALDLLAMAGADQPGRVLHAHGWDETRWPERRHPTRFEVDRAVGDRPAYVSRVDSHSAVVSSALLALRPTLAGAPGWSDDGRVERDAHHEVRDLVHGLWSRDDRREAIRRALRQAATQGLTSVHELNAPHIGPFDDLALVAEITGGEPTPEVVAYWGGRFGGGDIDATTADLVTGFAGDLNMDGAIGSRTAAMLEPYADADMSGHLYLDADQVRDHIVACTRAGVQGGFHVIGDRAVGEVVAGLRAAAAVVGADAMVAARHRLEHVEMPDDDQVKTLADLGVVASVQPAFDAAWGAAGGLYEQRLGARRAGPMNPFGRLLRAGVALAFGSDSPVTPLNPWAGIRAAVLHHEPAERLTTREAFDAHTRGGHRAARADTAGVLVPGAPATFAVWETGPRDRDGLPELHPDLDLPRCVLTVVHGEQIFDAEETR